MTSTTASGSKPPLTDKSYVSEEAVIQRLADAVWKNGHLPLSIPRVATARSTPKRGKSP
ncbi:MAG: hypothetical protein P8Y48_04605 [Novosphingobium sp.]